VLSLPVASVVIVAERGAARAGAGHRVLAGAVVAPAGAAVHVAPVGDVAHRVIVEVHGRVRVDLRGGQAVQVVVVEVLGEPEAVLLALGDVADQIIGIGEVLQAGAAGEPGLDAVQPAGHRVERPVGHHAIAQGLLGGLAARVLGVGGPVHRAG